jgi:hypothetical protein
MGHQEGSGEARRFINQGGDPIQFRILEFDFESNSESGPPQLQIDVQDTYDIVFGHSTYAWKENKIKFPMELVPCPTKIGFDHNC